MVRPTQSDPTGKRPHVMAEALFEADGDRFTPTELCRGPWFEDAQHGGPPGVGLAESRLWDEAGIIGRSLQSLLLEPA